MRITILPKTPLGKWSVGLAIAFILLFVLFQILVATGLRGAMVGSRSIPYLNWNLALYASGLSGIAALVTGIIGIIRKERAIPVFLATLIGLFVLFFLLGKFLVPH